MRRQKDDKPEAQNLLGKWVSGLKSGTSKSLFDEIIDKQLHESYASEQVVSHHDEGEFSHGDMVNQIIGFVLSLKGSRVIVCPACSRDVERFSDVFCKCGHCDILFFTLELIRDRSLRFPKNNEDISKYEVYAGATSVPYDAFDYRGEQD